MGAPVPHDRVTLSGVGVHGRRAPYLASKGRNVKDSTDSHAAQRGRRLFHAIGQFSAGLNARRTPTRHECWAFRELPYFGGCFSKRRLHFTFPTQHSKVPLRHPFRTIGNKCKLNRATGTGRKYMARGNANKGGAQKWASGFRWVLPVGDDTCVGHPCVGLRRCVGLRNAFSMSSGVETGGTDPTFGCSVEGATRERSRKAASSYSGSIGI